METNLTPFASLRKKVAHDGYPNLTPEEIEQVTTKDLNWFLKNVQQSIFINSTFFNGILEVNSYELASLLHESQKNGFKFLSLQERAKQALGYVFKCQGAADQEPDKNRIYTFNYYINGVLQETKLVQLIDLTDNKQFYVFGYIGGKDNSGSFQHRLPVGCFPTFIKTISPEAIICEQYSLTTETANDESE